MSMAEPISAAVTQASRLARTDAAIGRTELIRTPTGDGHHGQGTATQQSRNQETEEGQNQGDRGSTDPQGSGLAAGFRAGEEEVTVTQQSPRSRCAPSPACGQGNRIWI